MSNLNVALVLSLQNRLSRGIGEARRDLKGLKTDIGGMSASFGALKNFAVATGGFYAAKRAISATVGEAITFEKAMAEVKKKVDAPSPEAFARLEGTIRKTAIALGLPREQVAGLTAEAGAAGIAFNDLERFINLSAKAAVGWDMSPEEASQKLAEIKSATNMTIGEMEVLADKINALGDNSAAKERDIVDMFQRSAAAAKTANVSYDTSLAVLTAVRSTGMQSEVVARWFGAFTGGLRTIETKPKRVAAGLKILGLNAKKVADGMKRDALGTMIDIFDRLEKSPNAATAAIQIFGQEWWDETSRAKAAMPEIRKQLEMLKNPSNYKGSLQKNLQVELGTTASHLERLKTLASDIGDRLGRWALPGINSAIEGVLKKMDEAEKRTGWLERWRATAEASGEIVPVKPDDPKPEKPEDDWFQKFSSDVRNMVLGTRDPGDKIIGDWALGRENTVDPAGKRSVEMAKAASDADAIADKKGKESATTLIQSTQARGADRAALSKQARESAAEAADARSAANMDRRGAGVAGARDMSGVEGGEDLARAIVEGMRQKKRNSPAGQLRAKIESERERLKIEADNWGTTSAVGQSRQRSINDNIKGLEEQLRAIENGAEASANGVRDKLSLDLNAEGQQMMASLAGGINAGAPAAVAAAQAAGSSIRGSLISAPGMPAPISSSAPAPGPQASAKGGGGNVTVHASVNVQGVSDPERAASLAGQKLASAIKSSKSRALHDGTIA